MKPFDLEAAKRGEPIVRRDGTPVKFIAHVPEIGIIVVLGDGKYISTTSVNGQYVNDQVSKYDLFMAPKKRTVWVNLYSDGMYELRETEQEAENNAFVRFGKRIGGKAYPVEIEE